MARKPCDGSITGNVLEHGCGALNIGACRIAYKSDDDKTPAVGSGSFEREQGVGAEFPHHKKGWGQWAVNHGGRYPANLVLVGDAVAVELGEQSGPSGSGSGVARKPKPGAQPFRTDRGWNSHSMTRDGATAPEDYGDVGTAARYFKQVKP